MIRKYVKRWTIRVALIFGGLAVPAWACDVPLYLWALQRWEPDAYSVYLFHDGQLTPEQHTVLEDLKNVGNRGNLTVRVADVSSALDAETRAMWEEQTEVVLPWMVLRHPSSWPSTTTLWAGPLGRAEVDAIMDSPKRQELLRDLLNGSAVVWILVDGDDASERVLRETLAAWLVPLIVLGSMLWIGLLALANVRERRTEIGIWRALGFSTGQLLRVFLLKAAVLGVTGAQLGYAVGHVTGLVWSVWDGIPLSRADWVRRMDPLFLGVILLGAPMPASLASWIPSLLAAQQDPAAVLREE